MNVVALLSQTWLQNAVVVLLPRRGDLLRKVILPWALSGEVTGLATIVAPAGVAKYFKLLAF